MKTISAWIYEYGFKLCSTGILVVLPCYCWRHGAASQLVYFDIFTEVLTNPCPNADAYIIQVRPYRSSFILILLYSLSSSYPRSTMTLKPLGPFCGFSLILYFSVRRTSIRCRRSSRNFGSRYWRGRGGKVRAGRGCLRQATPKLSWP